MTVTPTVLAFDTSAAHCAAAVLTNGTIASVVHENMTRGQAERLMPMLQEVLDASEMELSQIDALGVGVGPGNFTGIRVAVSAARGLSLALRVQAYGITGFEAARFGTNNEALHLLPATRGQVYLAQLGKPDMLLPINEAHGWSAKTGLPIVEPPHPAQMVESIARITAERFPQNAPAPKPVYFRPADAAPAKDAPPVLLD